MRASCQIVSSSSDHRCHRAFFASRRQYEGNKKLPDCLRKATRLREALAMPSCSHRIIVQFVGRHRTCFGCCLAVDQIRGHLRAKFTIPYSFVHLVSISGQCDASLIVYLSANLCGLMSLRYLSIKVTFSLFSQLQRFASSHVFFRWTTTH